MTVAARQLFRRQALQHRCGGDHCLAPALQKGRPSLLLCGLGALLLAGLLALLLGLTYRATASARGVLNASGDLQRIVAPRSATLARLHVREGDPVRAGQRLATLVRREHDEQGALLQQSLVARLREEQSLLQQQLQLLERQFAQQQSRRQAQLAGKQQQLQDLRQETALVEAQLALQGETLGSVSKLLARGAVAPSDYRQGQLELMERQRALSQLRRQTGQVALAIADLQQQQQAADTDRQAQQLQMRRVLLEVEQRLQEAARQGTTTLVAPVDGRVHSIAFRVGDLVRAEQSLLDLRTSTAVASAIVWAPSRIAARLQPGQTLMLRLDAFDYRHYGRLAGVITSVSSSPLDPREYLLPVPGRDEALYRIEVAVQESAGLDTGQLPAATALTADFILEEKSLLGFILEPVLRLRGKLA